MPCTCVLFDTYTAQHIDVTRGNRSHDFKLQIAIKTSRQLPVPCHPQSTYGKCISDCPVRAGSCKKGRKVEEVNQTGNWTYSERSSISGAFLLEALPPTRGRPVRKLVILLILVLSLFQIKRLLSVGWVRTAIVRCEPKASSAQALIYIPLQNCAV